MSQVEQVRERVTGAHNVLVITGAGISVESGIATFRTDEGPWNKVNPLEYATRAAFARDPVKLWHWYDKRRENIAAARPNPAHQALAAIEASGRRVFIVTQNVDDLHERAGSREVWHIHGSIWEMRCERDGTVLDNHDVPLAEIPPLCHCGNVLRPGVVWFGESLPSAPLEAVRRHLIHGEIDVCLVVGTEASFGYVVEWAFQAKEQGALIVDVNPRETGLASLVDFRFADKAGDVLPKFVPPY